MRIPTIACVVSLVAVGLSAQSKQFVRPAPGQTPPYSPAIKAGGFIYVSGMLPTDAQGNVSGDVTAQTKQVFENIRGVLAQAGSSLDMVATATVMLQNAADFPAMDQVFKAQFPGEPPARTTIFGDMVRQGALVEIAVTAIPTGGQRKAILPAGWAKPTSPYNYAILSGDTLFMAGLVSRSGKDNSPVAGDMGVQVKTAMDNAGEVLKAAGMSYDDLASARVAIRDIAQWEDMNKVYRTYWQKDRPTRATVQAGLPGTYNVEITFIAVKSPSRQSIVPPNADGTAGQAGPNYSPAIKVGNRLFVSGGSGGTDANKGNMKAQTTETLTRLGAILKAGGFEFKDVVASDVWITNVKQFNDMNDGYRPVFPTDAPVRATVGVGALVSKDALVEIALTAVK